MLTTVVVFQCHRLEGNRHSRGGSNGAGHAVTTEIRAKYIEAWLREGEPLSDTQIGCIDGNQGATPCFNISKGAVVEDVPLIVIDRQFSTIQFCENHPYPVDRVKEAANQGLLYVAAQEDFLVVFEYSVAIKRVVGGCETSTGYRTDGVDFIQ